MQVLIVAIFPIKFFNYKERPPPGSVLGLKKEGSRGQGFEGSRNPGDKGYGDLVENQYLEGGKKRFLKETVPKKSEEMAFR